MSLHTQATLFCGALHNCRHTLVILIDTQSSACFLPGTPPTPIPAPRLASSALKHLRQVCHQHSSQITRETTAVACRDTFYQACKPPVPKKTHATLGNLRPLVLPSARNRTLQPPRNLSTTFTNSHARASAHRHRAVAACILKEASILRVTTYNSSTLPGSSWFPANETLSIIT